MPNATLLLGSNIGDRERFLASARDLIRVRAGSIVKYSPIQQSKPWGYVSDSFYLNQVVVIDTALEPLALLDILLDIEIELGRTRVATVRYADRTIDIDILYYDNSVVTHPRLTIPHPRIGERPFVISLLRTLDDFSISKTVGRLR